VYLSLQTYNIGVLTFTLRLSCHNGLPHPDGNRNCPWSWVLLVVRRDSFLSPLSL
jgi:hypothetical protein